MEIQSLFDKKRKAEIKDGLKKGKIPPRPRPRRPQPVLHEVARPQRGTRGETEENFCLYAAAMDGDLESVRDALERGAYVDADNYGAGMTALMVASSKGYKEIIGFLLSEGANVDAMGGTGMTALKLASMYGHKDIAELLISDGAGVDVTGWPYVTALMEASEHGHKEIAELLISKGADVNASDRRGNTALSRASGNGHTEIVELLRQHGAKD